MAPNRAFSTDHRWPEAAGFSSPLVDFLDLLQHGVGLVTGLGLKDYHQPWLNTER